MSVRDWRLAVVVGATLCFPPADDVMAGVNYDSVRITYPESEATIHDNGGNLDVSVMLVPSLDARGGDSLQLMLDGAVTASAGIAYFSLKDVPRGAHTIEVVVRDHADHILLRSAPVVVYMWRASSLFPHRASP